MLTDSVTSFIFSKFIRLMLLTIFGVILYSGLFTNPAFFERARRRARWFSIGLDGGGVTYSKASGGSIEGDNFLVRAGLT